MQHARQKALVSLSSYLSTQQTFSKTGEHKDDDNTPYTISLLSKLRSEQQIATAIPTHSPNKELDLFLELCNTNKKLQLENIILPKH